MFSTFYRDIDTIDGIMKQLTNLKQFETIDESAHRELEAIAAVLRACGVKWRFSWNAEKGYFEAHTI